MTGAYIDKDYVYAVARIRGAELKLLNQGFMDQLVQAKSATECLRLLTEKGWGSDGKAESPEDILAAEREKMWALIDELVPERNIFDVFLLPNDYNNLKAAIKESVMDYDYPGIYISEATVDPQLLQRAVKERNYGALPDDMHEVAQEAHETFLHTKDGQLCDVIVDKACMEALIRAGKASHDDFLNMYAELTAAAANIKVAVRAAVTGKDREFLQKALAECGTLDANALTNAALQGKESICSYLATTDYADAVEEVKKSLTAFERWCDNLVIRRIKPQLYNSFGLGPVAAYILARENEIKSVRIILAGKQNGFPEDVIGERVRETYV